ncbi:MAG: BlaI/MecI/CopY family transcriptional regulator [Promethearchaeota archaeon]
MDIEDSLNSLNKLIKEYAPEIYNVWSIRNDIFEDQGIKTGRMHENHILGIIMKHYLEDKSELTTADIEEEYTIYFRKIARSTVSTYLNQLEKEGLLYKKREGRLMKYHFNIEPPSNINPFWIVRNFCLLPAYFSRAGYLAKLYFNPPKKSEKYEKERLFLIGLAVLIILKNRHEKCYMCQFGLKSYYRTVKEKFDLYIKERVDVLPEDLRNYIMISLGELPLFGGIIINKDNLADINNKLIDLTDRAHSDIEFQISVSKRRQQVHLERLKKYENQEK